MSKNMDAVVAAAGFLDDYCDNPLWRDKIRVDQISMLTMHYCILGQVYGDYHQGKTKLMSAATARRYEVHEAAFANYGTEWQVYLSRPQSPSVPENLAGTKWFMNGIPGSGDVMVDHTFTKGEFEYVVFAHEGESFQVRTKDSFLTAFTRRVEYEDRGLYLSKNRSTVLVFDADRDRFLLLNGNGNRSATVTHIWRGNAEENYGPLTPITSSLSTFTGVNQHVKLEFS